MKGRWVCLPIDAITAILADYAGRIGFPADAKPVAWKLHPAKRQLMLVVESEELETGGPAVEEIKFHLRRTFLPGVAIGGPAT